MSEENCQDCGCDDCRVCEICWKPHCHHHEFKGPELFAIPESKSPRLLWMEKHCVMTLYDKARNQFAAVAYQQNGWGDTEDEAITQLALKLGIKLWNEEGGQP